MPEGWVLNMRGMIPLCAPNSIPSLPVYILGELRWDVVCVHFRTRLTASLPVGGLPLGGFEFLEVCEASQVTFLNFFIPLQLTGMRLFLFSFSSVAHYAPL